ncbi:MAG: UDP-N-acetyl-D-glucosamine dehydrogenase [Elusimicrobia bacterium RIFCSPHIGHO2_02_FULL_57_9]|nr:MAG: UDP-N-acetyl-D-glucosamine dehydrogenase [Elusimicrobia bacterium RIFCSPHIGHO2_02_FULL_57_9]
MNLESRLKNKTARIGILGLGYVGLPLAMEFCRKGLRVTGFDVSSERVAALRRGKSYVLDVPPLELKKAMAAGLFEAQSRFDRIAACDALIICVQTPLRKSKEPDVSNIVSAAGSVAKRLKKGQLVILESTTFPGATDEIVLPILQNGKRKLGRDFYLAFSPERVDPGNHRFGITNTPKVVGGADRASARLAGEVYSQIVDEVVLVSSTRSAEMVKLLENSFRSINIALVNEMAQICHRLGLDVWEIISAAATKPFGFMPFYPGPGIGGHCIPKDPQLLTWKMKTLNFEPRFIHLASAINGSMPRFTVDRIAEILNRDHKALNGSRILVLGVAYKPNTSDFRESPALDVIQLLTEAKAQVTYHDPFVPRIALDGRRMGSSKLTAEAVKSADCVAILTGHRDIDYAKITRLARRVFDARNVTEGLTRRNLHRL